MKCDNCKKIYCFGTSKCCDCKITLTKMPNQPNDYHLFCWYGYKKYYLELDKTKTIRYMKQQFLHLLCSKGVLSNYSENDFYVSGSDRQFDENYKIDQFLCNSSNFFLEKYNYFYNYLRTLLSTGDEKLE